MKKMENVIRLPLILLVVALWTACLPAAITVPAVVNGTATQPVLINTGRLLEAIDFGTTADTTLDGIPFDGWNPTSSGAVYTGANLTVTVTNAAGVAFSNYGALGTAPVWQSENYVSNTQGPITTVINGLAAGRVYRVQYMNYDGRNGGYSWNTPVMTLKDSSGASVEIDYNFGSLTDAFGLLTATVTGATSLTIIMPASPDPAPNGKSTQLDGLVVHDITGYAIDPDPVDGQGLALDPQAPLFSKVPVDKTLSWSAVSGAALDSSYPASYRVYLDPNAVKVQSGSGCAYFRDYAAGTSFDPASNLVDGATYYWRVDAKVKFAGMTDPNELIGGVWSFKTIPLNYPALVDAGPSFITWLAESQAGIVLDQAALVLAAEGDEAFTWSAVASGFTGFPAPAVSFEDAHVLKAKVFIEKTGTYLLKLVGTDGVNPAQSDLMQIRVYTDACEAARNNPNAAYVPLAYDFDSNCIENLDDYALMATQWLTHNYAEENILYTANLNERDLALWLDASDTSSLVVDPNTGQVSRWNDKSGNGAYLVTGGTAGNPLYAAAGLNGKGIVDFGPAYKDTGAGKWMQFKTAAGGDLNISNIRTVFWVLKGANFLLGDDNSYHFHRGGEVGLEETIWSGGNAHVNIRNGKTYLNGAAVNGTTTKLPLNYSQVSLVTVGNVEASRLCDDRGNIRTGGQQIAEILIFNQPLMDAERLMVEQYLKTKWGTP